eukprot:474920_1
MSLDQQQEQQKYNSNDVNVVNVMKSDPKTSIIDAKKSEITTDKSSQSSQSPPNNINIVNNHNNHQKTLYNNRLNKKSISPPDNLLFEYTVNTTQSPKRKSSSASDTPPRQQTQINYHTYPITNNKLPIKRSDKFGIQRNRNRNALSTKSVASGTSKFIYNNNT